MAKGIISSALNLLTNNMEDGLLPPNNDTFSKLIQKNPKGKAASQDISLNGPLQNIHPGGHSFSTYAKFSEKLTFLTL